MNNTSDKVKAIKAQLRSYMNGVVSYTMRKKGLDDYKLNFGVEYPRLKELAMGYEPNLALAEALWMENIRECKILAILLYPKDKFDEKTASIWVEQTPNIEIARLLCLNLLQHMPYAPNLSFSWIASENLLIQTIGYLTIARILPSKTTMDGRAADEFISQVSVAGQSDDYQLRQAALLAATGFMEQGTAAKNKMVAMVESFKNSSNDYTILFYDAIMEEASYL